MQRKIEISELNEILKDYFKLKGFSLRNLKIEDQSLLADLLPIKNKGKLTTVYVFLSQIESRTFIKSFTEINRSDLDRLLRSFSEGRLGTITMEELMKKKPEDILKESNGLGEKSIEFLQSLIKHNLGYLLDLEIDPEVDLFMLKLGKSPTIN